MVKEEIVTSLKNAIEHGENLEIAIQTLINSGYDSNEVHEASRYVGGGVIGQIETKDDEELLMPEEKGFFSKIFRGRRRVESSAVPEVLVPEGVENSAQEQNSITQQGFGLQGEGIQNPNMIGQSQTKGQTQNFQQMNPNNFSGGFKAKPLKPIEVGRRKKKSYMKEIILLGILIVLVGVLILSILFRENILGFFSG